MAKRPAHQFCLAVSLLSCALRRSLIPAEEMAFSPRCTLLASGRREPLSLYFNPYFSLAWIVPTASTASPCMLSH